MIICNPHNPTGRVYNEEELTKIANICRANNVLMICDEVHSDLIRHDVKFYPMMKVVGKEGLIVTTAVNKTFNLAGLQMTNMIIEDERLKERFKDYHSSPTPFGIASVIAAYNESEDWVDELNQYLDSLIDEVVNFININIPKCKVVRPEGSYILWLDFRAYNLKDDELKQKICNDARVIVQGGASYDEKDKDQFIRLCIASPKSKVMEALRRIANALK
jgi:cystathionine beta-lyase